LQPHSFALATAIFTCITATATSRRSARIWAVWQPVFSALRLPG